MRYKIVKFKDEFTNNQWMYAIKKRTIVGWMYVCRWESIFRFKYVFLTEKEAEEHISNMTYNKTIKAKK